MRDLLVKCVKLLMTFAVILFIVQLSGLAYGQEQDIHQLSAVEDAHSSYAYGLKSKTELVNGIEYFLGRRKDLAKKYGQQPYLLYKFDHNTLQVTPLIPREQQKNNPLIGAYGGMTTDPSGTLLAMTPGGHSEELGHHQNTKITVCHVNSGKLEVLVDDKDLKYSPSISPSGRFIAYYSSARDTNPRLASAIDYQENSLRMVNVATKEVTVITDYFTYPVARHYGESGAFWFDPPRWLDQSRLLYITFNTNPELILQQVDNLSGNAYEGKCALCYEVKNIVTGELKRIFMPDGSSPRLKRVDKAAAKIIFESRSLIIKTDYSLENAVVTKKDKEETK